MKKSRTNPIPEKIAVYSAMTLNQHYDIRGRLALETFQLKEKWIWSRRRLDTVDHCIKMKKMNGKVDVRIKPEPEDQSEFDGQLHIENFVAKWDSQDLVLLDPFAIWRQNCYQPRRNRYRRIVEQLIARGQESPLLLLFWTWGNDFPGAVGDLDGTKKPVRDGYQELRCLLHQAKRHFIRVTWRWRFQFAMWVLVPDSHLEALAAAL
jgi:hypothetical protein